MFEELKYLEILIISEIKEVGKLLEIVSYDFILLVVGFLLVLFGVLLFKVKKD